MNNTATNTASTTTLSGVCKVCITLGFQSDDECAKCMSKMVMNSIKNKEKEAV